MTLTASIPFIVFLVGVVLFALVEQPTIKEVARAMVWCGLLVALFMVAHTTTVKIP